MRRIVQNRILSGIIGTFFLISICITQIQGQPSVSSSGLNPLDDFLLENEHNEFSVMHLSEEKKQLYHSLKENTARGDVPICEGDQELLPPIEPSGGSVIYVGGSGLNNYTTIQEGVNAAIAGDTVYVYSGVYNEFILIEESIQLIGEDKNTTIIDYPTNDIVTVFADTVTISGFTIKGDYRPNMYGGIAVLFSGGTTISGNILVDNYLGIVIFYSWDSVITDNTFIDNSMGIYQEDDSYFIPDSNSTINSNTMISNDAGMIILWSSSNTITDNVIESTRHYALFLGDSHTNTILNNTISSEIWTATGLYMVVSEHNVISDNKFFYDGIVLDSSQHTVSGNTVNGKPLVYLEGKSHSAVTNAGQVILMNCEDIAIRDQNLSRTDIGITLIDTHNCLIQNNTFWFETIEGIAAYNSNGNTIQGNTVGHCGVQRYLGGYGVYLFSSNENVVIENTVYGGARHGIGLGSSSHNFILNNTMIGVLEGGVRLFTSSNNEICGNTITDTLDGSIGAGVDVTASSMNNLISHNIISSNNGVGLRIQQWDIFEVDHNHNNRIISNTITHNSLGMLIDNTAEYTTVIDNIISNNGDGFFHGSNNTIIMNNMLISNSLTIEYPAQNNKISHNTFNNGGLYIFGYYYDIHHNTITDNTVNGKPLLYLEQESDRIVETIAGQVILVDCTNITVQNLEIANTIVGILLWGSTHCTIQNNNITSVREGVFLQYSAWTTLTFNTVTDSSIGVFLGYQGSHNNTMTNNIVRSNSYAGLYLFNSHNSVITRNSVEDNTYGINLLYSPGSIIYHNNFIANNQHVNLDDSTDTIWDNGYPEGGNYWDLYDGADRKHGPDQNISGPDGIGDSWYEATDEGDFDQYPLMKPWKAPYIPKTAIPVDS